jgi:gamma-glutamylcyclotransferase (GGCT)/AIG2-like uncharacterized protein YtfP
MSTRVFVYGTLEIPTIVERVCGCALPQREAVLRGYARFLLKGQCYPAVTEDRKSSVEGSLLEQVNVAVLARLDAYEGEQYERRALYVEAGGNELKAWVYVLKSEYTSLLSRTPWDRELFEEKHYAGFMASL